MKRCSKCRKLKPAHGFYVRADLGRPRSRAACKACAGAANQQHLNTPAGKVRRAEYRMAYKTQAAENGLRRRYGIGLAEYEQMLAVQSGGCAICGKAPNGSRLAVDHDHTTGAIRGLLCTPCNRALGLYEGRGARLVDYLANPPARVLT